MPVRAYFSLNWGCRGVTMLTEIFRREKQTGRAENPCRKKSAGLKYHAAFLSRTHFESCMIFESSIIELDVSQGSEMKRG